VVGHEEELLSPSPNARNEFRRKIVETYLGALVQSMLSSTRDLREFVRLGRSLWPVYVQPLLSSNIEGTMGIVRTSCLARKPRSSTSLHDNISSSDLESELLPFLDKRFLAIIGKSLAMGLYSLSMDSPVVVKDGTTVDMGLDYPRQLPARKMPYLRACLLLAAFICQNNKADKDKRVFSIQGNGKKRARHHQPMERTDDIAFISRIGALQQLRVVRPRPFPLERMLSIFVTIVSLNPPTTPTPIGNGDDLLRSLGSSHLFGNLAQLCDLGYLHQISNTIGSIKSEVLALTGSKYWCSLSRDEALSIATSFDIPLNNYLM
jgi:Origin recognition complex (ORC) subunit 5 C-terminus